jgi:N-acetylglucosaminyldiphosphoundecaprenol N-acetyl-beta-D-mannosaminyltransferase
MTNVNILDIPFSKKTTEETVSYLHDHIEKKANEGVFHVVTANPEIVMLARKSRKFKRILSQANLITPDGIGIVIGSKLLGTPIAERVAGYDTLHRFLDFRESKQTKTKIFAVGAKEEVITLAVEKIKEQYPSAEIVGYHNGYFSAESDEEKKIIQEINEQKPDLLLVGLGAPRQEEFIFTYKEGLQAKIAIGVGGSFDVLSGTTKRAPEFFQRFYLEWFWRLITQPSRWKRQLLLPQFVLAVLKEKILKKEN